MRLAKYFKDQLAQKGKTEFPIIEIDEKSIKNFKLTITELIKKEYEKCDDYFEIMNKNYNELNEMVWFKYFY
jgi:hypothetical protein